MGGKRGKRGMPARFRVLKGVVIGKTREGGKVWEVHVIGRGVEKAMRRHYLCEYQWGVGVTREAGDVVHMRYSEGVGETGWWVAFENGERRKHRRTDMKARNSTPVNKKWGSRWG